ncbi:nucleotidyltransferase family protein [Nocardioides daphniae]|uniref:Nucleotidyltransferase family protein n=1 Tax=Nocardioides daphniae TaxID=402297 RepID=A0A4P7U914_9ACTN|nr:nucleotidyltransferase family protein [Nocardioides daphniae]QCC76653.1 hypothetical protein E2C04_04485 [Nocardioides daphniae]
MTGPATEVQHPDGSLDAERVTGAEAMQLLYALTADVARRTGTRVLAIKGATLSHHGLRAPRVSADIDVLMHPDDVDTFVAGMEAAGWRRRGDDRPQDDAVPLGQPAQRPLADGDRRPRLLPRLPGRQRRGLRGAVASPGPDRPGRPRGLGHRLASSASIAALHHLRAPWQPTNMAALDALTGLAAPQLTGEAGQDLLDCARRPARC